MASEELVSDDDQRFCALCLSAKVCTGSGGEVTDHGQGHCVCSGPRDVHCHSYESKDDGRYDQDQLEDVHVEVVPGVEEGRVAEEVLDCLHVERRIFNFLGFLERISKGLRLRMDMEL